MAMTDRWDVESLEAEARWQDAEANRAERQAAPCGCACRCQPNPRQTARYHIAGALVCGRCAIYHGGR